MKKFTLALSAMMTCAAAAMAASPGSSYVIVPADATTQASGKYLTVNAEGSLAYSNDLSAAAIWSYEIGQQDENFNFPYYLKNGDKYLSISEDGATMTTDATMTFVDYSWDVDGASVMTNGNSRWFPALPQPFYYLNALNLGVDPESSASTAFFFVEADENTSAADVENALWSMVHPQAKVIAVGGETAREKGKYLAVTAEGRLITTNTLDDNAVWEQGYDYETDAPVITNLGVKGYLYQGTEARKITLSETPVAINMIESQAIIGAWGLTTDMEATPGSYTFLNALNTTDGTTGEQGGIGTWNLDEGSSFFVMDYDRSVTAAEIDEEVSSLIPMGIAKASAIASARKYMNSSATGRNYGESELIAIENAESTEEIATATAAAIQKAIEYAEMNLESGCMLKNTRTGEYINNVDSETKPLVRETTVGLNSLWIAEMVTDTNEGTEAANADETYWFNTFKLRNAATGKYMGKCPGNSQSMPVADAENAATMKLVAGSSGFEIIQTNSGINDAYVNVSTNPEAPELTIWTYANDAGAFFTFENLPAAEDGLAWVNFVGEYTLNEYMGTKDYTSISAIEIAVPVNATATGVGEAVLGLIVEDPMQWWSTSVDTLSVWNGNFLLNATPEVREVEHTYYDPFTWQNITETVEAKVYTLMLRNVVTEGGDYTVQLSPNMFALTEEGNTTFLPAFSGSASIVAPAGEAELIVLPEAGEVEELSMIQIDPEGVNGWAPNWESAEKLTVTFNGEVASDANGEPIEVDGDELMSRYDAFDPETWTGGGWNIPVNYTQAGTYVLTVPAGMLADEAFNFNELTEIEWTIKEQDGIMQVSTLKVNGNVIYDLQGRRVSKAQRGLYIVNGVKVYNK